MSVFASSGVFAPKGAFGSILRPVLRSLGAGSTLLAGYGYLAPGLTFSRASAASYTDEGGIYRQVAADTPRFQDGRLLVEASRTNTTTNPLLVGHIAGAPGTLPSGWTYSGSFGTVSREILGTTVIDGVLCLLLRVFGTPSATAGIAINMGPNETVDDQTDLTNSCYVALVGGTWDNVGILTLRSRTSGGISFTPTSKLTRYIAPDTRAAGGTAGTALRWSFLSTEAPVDFTLAVGLPQRELGTLFATSPITPSAGTVAASTRAPDTCSGLLSALGLSAQGFTISGQFVIQQTGNDQGIVQWDAGSDNTRVLIVNQSGTTNIRVRMPSTSLVLNFGSITHGAINRFAASYDASGRFAMSLNGAAPLSATGGPTNCTTLRLGHNAGGSAYLFGTVSASARPFVVPDADLPALAAGAT